MTIKEKILSYLDATGKVKTEFYKAIGASPSISREQKIVL